MGETIKIGISMCLLGEKVRYDGGHKHDRYLTGTLGQFVEYVPVCPEVECGFGIPRESFRLTGDPESPRLVTSRTRRDVTDRMKTWAEKRVSELVREDLCGFIFKSNSPSSGMERVRVYNDEGMPVKKGRGLFAQAFMEAFPLIPVEEEGRLHDMSIRENFIERIFALKRWREMIRGRKRIGLLVDFHTRNKLLCLAHSQKHYRMMGRLVARAKGMDIKDAFEEYEKHLMEALRLKATNSKNSNVLHHMMGYFKKQLSGDEKKELLEIIEQYRLGNIPLIVPVTLMRHYVRKYNQTYLADQTYLNPHPASLRLRNHA